MESGKTLGRQSNMELLRIVAMFLIVLFHCSYKSGFEFDYLTINNIIIKSFWMFGELGVNLFTLVSGYFLINGRFKGEKVIYLLCQVLFYWLISVAVAIEIGIYSIEDLKSFILLFFPTITNRYWYVTAYIVLYLFIPWINPFLKQLSQRRFILLLLVALVLWSIIPTFVGMLNNRVESMLFYSRFIWIAVVYAIGAYIRLYPPRFYIKSKKSVILTLVSAVLIVVSIIVIAQHPRFFAKVGITEWAYFWPPNTILMVALSLGVFGIFLNIRIPQNRIVNRIASTTFGIYLLHDGIFQVYLWKTMVNALQYQGEPQLVVYMVCAALAVFLTGVFVDLVRQFIEKFTLTKLFSTKLWAEFKGKVCAIVASAIEWATMEKEPQKTEKQER